MKKLSKTLILTGLLLAGLATSAWAEPVSPRERAKSYGQPAASTPVGTAFSTPEAATRALAAAIQSYDRRAMSALFGPDLHKVESADPAERATALQKLEELFEEGWSLSTNQGGDRVIRLGAEGWSFPVPLTKTAKGWQFDTQAGVEEVANRRVGRNELAMIDTFRLLMEAESLYHDSQGKYTSRLVSGEGQKDGLFWPPEGDNLSPLGQTFGDVATFSTSRHKGDPWFGYYFDVRLTENGYLISAWPQIYQVTGVMSFTCDQNGKLYEQDLGPSAGSFLRAMESISADDGWTIVDD